MCALFGIHDYADRLNSRQKELILKVLSTECEVRGRDATGIAYSRNKKLQVCKRPIPAHKMQYHLPLKVKVIMGHTRFTTQGSEKHNHNNHPFAGRVKHNTFVLAHNGIIHNDTELRQSMKLPKTNIETDSYIAVQIIEKENSISFGSLRKVAETVTGSFVFTVLDSKDNLYFVRGDNPLCIYHFTDKEFYLYASTEDILQNTLDRLGINNYVHEKIPVEMGDILHIDSNGNMKKEQFDITDYYVPSYSFQYPVYIYGRNDRRNHESADSEYLDMLKQISGLYGYTPNDIDELLAEGWTLQDIEQILYGDCEEEIYYERVN